MAERDAEVVAAPGGLRLRLLGQACAGCGGCGGRCSLFATDASTLVEMPEGGEGMRPGQRVRLVLDDEQLRIAAWRGYGVALLGLLAGAAAGQALGGWLGAYANALALLGLVAGPFAAVRFSKPRLPAPRVIAAGQGTPPASPSE